jgi:hypothetical protein
LDGDGIFELGEVDVTGRVCVVLDVDRRRAHYFVVVAKPLVAEGARSAGVSVDFSLFTKFV